MRAIIGIAGSVRCVKGKRRGSVFYLRILDSRDARGFTLIELLIGIVISAVLLWSLYAVFFGMLRMQTRAYAVLEEVAPRGQVIDVVRKDIENAVAPKSLLCGPMLGQTETQEGERADTLELYTADGRIDQVAPWGDVQKVTYSLVEALGAKGEPDVQLVRVVTRNLLATDPEEQTQTTTLLHGVSSLEFQYFDGQTWTDSWDSTAAPTPLPTAISVRVTFELGEVRTVARAPLDIVCEVVLGNPAATSEGAST